MDFPSFAGLLSGLLVFGSLKGLRFLGLFDFVRFPGLEALAFGVDEPFGGLLAGTDEEISIPATSAEKTICSIPSSDGFTGATGASEKRFRLLWV